MCDAVRSIRFRGREQLVAPISYGQESWRPTRDAVGPCEACGAPPGTYHHPGCRKEQCRACRGYYADCPCDTWEKELLDASADHECALQDE